jgi:N,N'-diacetyllegionaminate synthase
MKTVEIGGKKIGEGERCFVIAEAGVNHNGDLSLAKRLVEAAAEAGADAVKFQNFKASELISAAAPKAKYQSATTGDYEGQLEMVKRLEMSEAMTRELAQHAADHQIIFLSTAFDEVSVDFLDAVGVPAFKVGSGDLTDLPLLSYIGNKRKPVLLSTGMSYLEEVKAAVTMLFASGCSQLALFHCVSSYPSDPEAANLRAIKTLKDQFDVPVGFSDHSLGEELAVAATALGANLIEKHLTLDRDLPGPDHRASLLPAEFKHMVRSIRSVEIAFGDGVKRPTQSEANVRDVARRSIVAARTIPKGAIVTRDMLAFKRPGTGVSPALWETLVGKKTVREIPFDTLISIGDLA